jgi:hypothetical protein
MWVYWTMFCAPALASLSPWRLNQSSRAVVLAVTAIVLILVIGLRDEVGADWSGYTAILDENAARSLTQILIGKEPGFGLITWISIQLGWGLYGVDVLAAIIFVAGLSAFLIRQPNPWMCLSLAVPVLVIQLGMSGIRQACAVGFLCFAFNAFVDRRILRYIVFSLLAFTFHQTALIFVPLITFVDGKVSVIPTILSAILLASILFFALRDVGFYNTTYVLQDLGAVGALPRIGFNVSAAIVFLLVRKHWQSAYPDFLLFYILAIITLVMSPFVFFAQVAVDRLEYYMIPFQIAVLSRAPQFLPRRLGAAFTALVFAGYGAALAVWLNYSWIAQLTWLPYRSLIFEPK